MRGREQQMPFICCVEGAACTTTSIRANQAQGRRDSNFHQLSFRLSFFLLDLVIVFGASFASQFEHLPTR